VARFFPRLLLLSGAPSVTIPSHAARPTGFNSTAFALREVGRIAEGQIVIPSSLQPSVSIIVPVFGKIEYTLQCLASIAAHPPLAAFEVIVVDDCSLDDTAEVLSRVAGIRLARHETNRGFIEACNTGASLASGEYLHFLNNDTVVTPGWLDELLKTFEA